MKFIHLHSDALTPFRATSGSAGLDVHSIEKVVIPAGSTVPVRTGLAVQIPPGYEVQVRSRSGLAKKSVFVINSPGTIDSDFTGEILVLLHNASKQDFHINFHDRIAQLVYAQYVHDPNFQSDVVRSGGFGSTGVVPSSPLDFKADIEYLMKWTKAAIESFKSRK